MSKRLPELKRVPPTDDRERSNFDGAVKETLEVLTGRRGVRISKLPSGAGTEAIVAKINEIISLLQDAQ